MAVCPLLGLRIFAPNASNPLKIAVCFLLSHFRKSTNLWSYTQVFLSSLSELRCLESAPARLNVHLKKIPYLHPSIHLAFPFLPVLFLRSQLRPSITGASWLARSSRLCQGHIEHWSPFVTHDQSSGSLVVWAYLNAYLQVCSHECPALQRYDLVGSLSLPSSYSWPIHSSPREYSFHLEWGCELISLKFHPPDRTNSSCVAAWAFIVLADLIKRTISIDIPILWEVRRKQGWDKSEIILLAYSRSFVDG